MYRDKQGNCLNYKWWCLNLIYNGKMYTAHRGRKFLLGLSCRCLMCTWLQYGAHSTSWTRKKLKSGFTNTRQYPTHSHVLMNNARNTRYLILTFELRDPYSSKGLDIRSYFWCTSIVLKIEVPWDTSSAKNRSWNCSWTGVNTRHIMTVLKEWTMYIGTLVNRAWLVQYSSTWYDVSPIWRTSLGRNVACNTILHVIILVNAFEHGVGFLRGLHVGQHSPGRVTSSLPGVQPMEGHTVLTHSLPSWVHEQRVHGPSKKSVPTGTSVPLFNVHIVRPVRVSAERTTPQKDQIFQLHIAEQPLMRYRA